MDTATLTSAAVAIGVCLAVAHFAPNQAVKAGAYGVIGVIVAKQVPFVQSAV